MIILGLLFWFGIFLLPPFDPDLGWQLRCGKVFWEGGGFCSVNSFSVLLEGYRWVNHSWGYQAVLYPIYKLFGANGLRISGALLMMASMGVLAWGFSRWGRLQEWLVWLAVSIFGWQMFGLGIRSQVLGFFWLCVLVSLFARTIVNRKYLYLVPAVLFFWVNSHGSFALGVFLTGAFVSHLVLNRKVDAWKGGVVLVSGLMVTLLNPFGWRVYEEAFSHVGGELGKMIAEWVPPRGFERWLVVVVGVLLAGVVVWVRGWRGGGLLVMLGGSLYLALQAGRNVVNFVVVMALVTYLIDMPEYWKRKLIDVKVMGLCLVVPVFGVMVLPLRFSVHKTESGQIDGRMVEGAVEYLRSRGARGKVFNRYEWGGYLIWALPEQKIFVDGRMPAWRTLEGKSPYQVYLETLQTRDGWEATLEKYDLDWILISPDTFMDLLLRADSKKYGWEEKYRDRGAVVYGRIGENSP